MLFPRLTWAGLLLSTLGWGLLLSYPLLAPRGAATPDAGDSVRFVLVFGENLLMTGLAIAMLGVCEKMIGLLARGQAGSAASKPASSSSRLSVAHAHAHAHAHPSQQLMSTRPATNEVVTKGALGGRDYVLFRDGSVVVETLLGPRRFLSLTEAQEFIGEN
jgi:hypothetical protein